MPKVRSFVAVELDEVLLQGLVQLQRRLKERVHLPVRWARPDGVHLTLKFLGDVEADQVGRIQEALAGAVASVGPFWVALGELGAFPSLRRPRVLWVGLAEGMEPLAELHRRVERALAPLGFSPEGRPFQPHLTLGRVRSEGPPPGRWDPAPVERLGGVVGLRQHVDRLSLMKSDLQPSGAVYTRLAAFQLQERPLS